MGKALLKVEAHGIAEECAKLLKSKYGAEKVYLIGSLADGERYTEYSDIDLAVVGLSSFLYFKALADLMRRYFSLTKIDLIPFEDCSKEFQNKITNDGEILIG
jgi:predicted nucleotidyltransferase